MAGKDIFDPLSNSGFGRLGKNWVLCLGAGINSPALPNWDDLVRSLVQTVFGTSALSAYDEIQSEKAWSADAWIQVCLNKTIENCGTTKEFRQTIAKIIYKPILFGRSKAEEEILLKGLYRVSLLRREEFILFFELVTEFFKNTTVLQLANILAKKI